MATQVKKAKSLTAKELAQKADVSPALLRKLLRKEFNRTGKVLVEGNRSEYRFDLSDPVTKKIIDRAKEPKEEQKENRYQTNLHQSQPVRRRQRNRIMAKKRLLGSGSLLPKIAGSLLHEHMDVYIGL